jgi:hypothetical protein
MVTALRFARNLFSRESLRALPAASLLAVALLAAAPAEWFLSVRSIRFVQTAEGRMAVIQARTVWPGDALRVLWSAQVDRLTLADGGRVMAGTACIGSGEATIRDDDVEIVRMSLGDWVGDPACRLEAGVPHVAQARWRFTVLGFPKTATWRAPVFVRRDMEVALDG